MSETLVGCSSSTESAWRARSGNNMSHTLFADLLNYHLEFLPYHLPFHHLFPAALLLNQRALTHKRIEAAAIQRSLSGRQAAASISHLLMPPHPFKHAEGGHESIQKQMDDYAALGPRYGAGGSSSGAGEGGESDLLTQLRNRPGVGMLKGRELSAAERQQRALEEEARTSAKQVKERRGEESILYYRRVQ